MHALASAADSGGGAVDGISELAKQGVLGLVASLLILALIWVTKNWKTSMEDRLADAKGYGADLKAINDAATNLVVETNRSSDALRTTCVELKADVTGTKEELGKLRERQAEFIAAAKGLNG
jgi:hypothetical protein